MKTGKRIIKSVGIIIFVQNIFRTNITRFIFRSEDWKMQRVFCCEVRFVVRWRDILVAEARPRRPRSIPWEEVGCLLSEFMCEWLEPIASADNGSHDRTDPKILGATDSPLLLHPYILSQYLSRTTTKVFPKNLST